MDNAFTVQASLIVLLIAHVCLVFTTGHSSFWWVARGFDALEAAQRATAFCLLPWWRRWRRQFVVEYCKIRRATEAIG